MSTKRTTRFIAAVVLAAVFVAGCGSDDDTDGSAATSEPSAEGSTGSDDTETLFPDVIDVEVTGDGDGDGEFTVAATLSSPYDSPDRYADAWRVLDADGAELGVRELGHDHAGEQPFTRQATVTIPDDVDRITVEGRDQVSGYGGETVTVDVPR